jgi:hypothetical protein
MHVEMSLLTLAVKKNTSASIGLLKKNFTSRGKIEAVTADQEEQTRFDSSEKRKKFRVSSNQYR